MQTFAKRYLKFAMRFTLEPGSTATKAAGITAGSAAGNTQERITDALAQPTAFWMPPDTAISEPLISRSFGSLFLSFIEADFLQANTSLKIFSKPNETYKF